MAGCPEPEKPEIEFEPIGETGLPAGLTCNANQGRFFNGLDVEDITESQGSDVI